MRSMILRVTGPLLMTAGFAAGAVFVASCGGSGGSAQGGTDGTGGSQAVRHVYQATVPSMHVATGFVPTVFDTVTYTPADLNDVPLGVRVRGNADVSNDSCTLHVSLVLPGSSTLGIGQVSIPVGADQDFTIVASMPSVGILTTPQTTHDFSLSLTGPFVLPPDPPRSSNVTINDLDVEVIVLEGVEVSNPSPRLQ